MKKAAKKKKIKEPHPNLIQQEDERGCAIACLAMACDITYEDMREEVAKYWNSFKFMDEFQGLNHHDEDIILFKLNKETRNIRPFSDHEIDWKKFVGPRRAILSVPSLNYKGFYHAVYWDGKKLHDPSKKKTYTVGKAWNKMIHIKMISHGQSTHKLNGINHEI